MLKFDGNEDIEKLEKVLLNMGKEALEKNLVDTAALIVADATLNSPVGKTARGYTDEEKKKYSTKTKNGYTGGRLRKSWEISKVSRVGNGSFHSRSLTISNNTHYAIHVEFGHRTRLGTGKKSSKLGGKRVVEGQFFLSNAVERAFKKLDLKIGGK
ncbi:MAG: HK97 gp10 family phage protein [Fusobacteriaceae bacterium]